MKMSFRWYGKDDPVTLEKIRQIPGVEGIVSSVYDIPPGKVWPRARIRELSERISKSGLSLSVIESVPVPEEVKMGSYNRDELIDNYCQTLINLARENIEVVCYNFMPVFDWTRTQLNYRLSDGSQTLFYQQQEIEKINPRAGELDLPGWDTSYEKEELSELLAFYHNFSREQLWDSLQYFLKKIIPVAEEVGIKMAIHPDDPPWSIFGLPRIITGEKSIERLLKMVDSTVNGITLCVGSLGVDPQNDPVWLIERFSDRIHFAHLRNIKIIGEKDFYETAHLSCEGSLDMYEIMKALFKTGFDGPLRPDHGRMIWGEEGKPGYGLYDRALGTAYLNGILEVLQRRDI